MSKSEKIGLQHSIVPKSTLIFSNLFALLLLPSQNYWLTYTTFRLIGCNTRIAYLSIVLLYEAHTNYGCFDNVLYEHLHLEFYLNERLIFFHGNHFDGITVFYLTLYNSLTFSENGRFKTYLTISWSSKHMRQ
jgi:hypothetical protein